MFPLSLLTSATYAAVLMQDSKPYMVQDALPFAMNGLEPIMSEHQLDLHYNKHHSAYVSKFNLLID